MLPLIHQDEKIGGMFPTKLEPNSLRILLGVTLVTYKKTAY